MELSFTKLNNKTSEFQTFSGNCDVCVYTVDGTLLHKSALNQQRNVFNIFTVAHPYSLACPRSYSGRNPSEFPRSQLWFVKKVASSLVGVVFNKILL